MPLIRNDSKSLLLLLFLILYTLADDPTRLDLPFQDSSSSAISFPHDVVDDSNGLELSLSGWTTAPVDLGNSGDDLIDQQDVFLNASADQTMVACPGPATSQDGRPPNNPGKTRSRLVRKRDPPESCAPPGYLKDDTAPPSSSDGTSTTTDGSPGRPPGKPPGKTVPKSKPIQIPTPLPLLGDPNSPLCNQYFPGVGSNYAVCYYPYFKTVPRSPLVHMLSPCRACESLIFRQTFFSKRKSLDGRDVKPGGLETLARTGPHRLPPPTKPSVVRDMN